MHICLSDSTWKLFNAYMFIRLDMETPCCIYVYQTRHGNFLMHESLSVSTWKLLDAYMLIRLNMETLLCIYMFIRLDMETP